MGSIHVAGSFSLVRTLSGCVWRYIRSTADGLLYRVLKVEERFETVSMEPKMGLCEVERSENKVVCGLYRRSGGWRQRHFICEALCHMGRRQAWDYVRKGEIFLSLLHP